MAQRDHPLVRSSDQTKSMMLKAQANMRRLARTRQLPLRRDVNAAGIARARRALEAARHDH